MTIEPWSKHWPERHASWWVRGLSAAAMLASSCASPSLTAPPPPAPMASASEPRQPPAAASQGSPGGASAPPQNPGAAARLLFQRLLAPDRKEESSTILDLVKIGKPASTLMLDVLANKDTQISALVAKINSQNPRVHVEQAATVLGNIGRTDAIEPLMVALKAAPADRERVAIALALLDLPPSPASIKLLQETFEALSRGDDSASGPEDQQTLAAAFPRLLTPTIVPWLVRQASPLVKIHDHQDERQAVMFSLLKAATRLMTKEQIALVKPLVDLRREVILQTPFHLISRHLQACGEKIPCHLDKLIDPEEQAHWDAWGGVKAAYSLAALGDETTRAEIVKRLPGIQNDVIREAALSAIDHLSPNGDAATADALAALLDRRPSSWKPGSSDLLLPLVIARLRARAA